MIKVQLLFLGGAPVDSVVSYVSASEISPGYEPAQPFHWKAMELVALLPLSGNIALHHQLGLMIAFSGVLGLLFSTLRVISRLCWPLTTGILVDE